MKGIIYELTISESAFEAIHGEYFRIREIYIPSIGVSINKEGVWKTGNRRYSEDPKAEYLGGQRPNICKIKDIDIEDSLKDDLFTIIKARELSKNISGQMIKELKLPKCKDCENGFYKDPKEPNTFRQCKTCHGRKVSYTFDKKEEKK
jgi:hypothetical protein